ncbi:MFS transporter (macronuclear) [Tetrahymena thermophila SB210]|uniref:Lysosomal dipeptide transporter MFSD1 n=1 Tax=Tetrahymena thermophila (strain SB210) TaxID=312017 RepID=I7M9Q8_TETTS|nr:MFS transporter [Tetrahymena thermophila SB210]EAS02630.1 MFS transporter [Tetrahymena thermophila SB210]|eukprot:XP_001022875.1 MFS transporter [Tetrahymena thermophila SB210]
MNKNNQSLNCTTQNSLSINLAKTDSDRTVSSCSTYSDTSNSGSGNSFIETKRLWMLPLISSITFGAFFNVQFQSFIKQQLMDQMHMNNNDYALFVLIPTIPNIPLDLVIGPILDTIGARLGIIISTVFVAIGLAICMISISCHSFTGLIFGKSLLSVAAEAQGIGQGCVAGKWFTQKGLAMVFTVLSFLNKVASSSSGIIYPNLYNSSGSVMTPLGIGLGCILLTIIVSVGIYILDKRADEYEPAKNNENQVEKPKLQFSDIKKYDKMFWFIALQCPLMFGAFYSFMNYLQSILITKFFIDKTTASELVSIPYWIAMTTPIFGILADKYGKRLYFMCCTTFLSFLSALILLLVPTGENYPAVYISLIIFGVFLSMMCCFLYPNLPLLSEKYLLSTAFAICYATKNAGTAILNYLGGLIMKNDNSGYNNFLITFLFIYLTAFIISIGITLYDRKHGGIINSNTPQRYLEYIKQRRNGSTIN